MIGSPVAARFRLDQLGGIAKALRHRNYAIYLTGMFVSLNGSFVFAVAVGWLTWELTGSAGWVGTMVFAETLPNTLLAPFAGAIIDRGRALRIFKYSQLGQSIFMSVLAAITLLDALSVEILLGFSVAVGIFNGFAVPAHFALVPRMVPREDLSPALALQSSCAQSARFIGPAIAGIFLVTLGAGAAFLFNAITYFFYLGALTFIRIDDSPSETGGQRGLFGDIAEGLAYMRTDAPIRLLLMIAVCLGFLLRPTTDLMPAFVGAVFEGGPKALSLLLSTAGGSALLAALWLARRGDAPGLTRIMFVSMAVSAASIFVFALQPNLAVGVVLIAVYAFAVSAVSVANMSLLQTSLQDRMRARVMGLFSLTHRAIPAAGAFALGNIASASGLPLPIPLAGAAVLGFLLWVWFRREARPFDYETPQS